MTPAFCTLTSIFCPNERISAAPLRTDSSEARSITRDLMRASGASARIAALVRSSLGEGQRDEGQEALGHSHEEIKTHEVSDRPVRMTAE